MLNRVNSLVKTPSKQLRLDNQLILDYESLMKMIPNSDEIVIYGWEHCGYEKILKCFSEASTDLKDSPFKSVEGHILQYTPAKIKYLTTDFT